MTNESDEVVVRVVERYISVEGSYINSLGERLDSVVEGHHIANRVSRDGQDHHITLINHVEIAEMCKNEQLSKSQQKKLYRKELYRIHRAIVDTFGSGSNWEKPVDIGLGICSQDDAVSYFRVIYWPFGQAIRRYLRLPPANFHITLGFSPKDVHLYKGPGSLLCLQKSQVCNSLTMNQLITYVDMYPDDTVFTRKLFEACWRNGLYAEATQLGKVCATSLLSKYYANYFSSANK